MTPSSNPPTRGTILFAHGSRDPLWCRPIEAVAQRVRQADPQHPVRCAYLELSSPDLMTSAQELVNLGVRRIHVVPMFLGMGKHTRQDLPEHAAQLQRLHPHIEIELKPAVGEDERLLDLLAQIALD